MKVYIITLHSIHNFGSVFQAMALEKYLETQGYDTEIIDYRPNYNLAGKRKLITLVGKILNWKDYCIKKNKFNRFIETYMNLSPLYKNIEELRNAYESKINEAVFIAGGDQLWNPFHYCGNDPAYRLAFLPKDAFKISFGTSLGQSSFTEDELKELTKDIREFKCIGVREASSVPLLMSKGIQKVKNVCDPVLLLDKSFYKNILKNFNMREKYILVYLVDKSELLDECLELLKKTYGYKIIHVCGFRKKFENDYMIKNEGPEEVLGLVSGAEYVVSASFHATLFSLIFEKQFITFLPNIHTNSRITELLNMVQLENRIIKNKQDLPNIFEHVDYLKCRQILKNYVSDSKMFIDNILVDKNEK